MRYAIPSYVERNSMHRILTIPLESLDNRSDVQIARIAYGCVLWRFQKPSGYSKPRCSKLSIPMYKTRIRRPFSSKTRNRHEQEEW